MKEKSISYENLLLLVDDLIKSNQRVIAPTKDGIEWMQLNTVNDLSLNGKAKPTNISYKEYIFPKSEPLFYFNKKKNEVELTDPVIKNEKLIFFGAKPCDASAIRIMQKVFNWDYEDEFFNTRKNNSVVIGMACEYSDDFCFCTSLELSPVSEKGSDLFLIPLSDGNYHLRIITKTGEEFIRLYQKYFTDADSARSAEVLNSIKLPERKFEGNEVKKRITENFENQLFDKIGETCLSCGQCAFVCPVCHCFDIVDEECDYSCGRRMKNWDACQFSLFTLHGSGHNPRYNQGMRYRQRISHKFKYYPEKFNEILCTGCGRCSRGCPVGIDIAVVVQELNSVSLNQA